jgi:hypothetical protein
MLKGQPLTKSTVKKTATIKQLLATVKQIEAAVNV